MSFYLYILFILQHLNKLSQKILNLVFKIQMKLARLLLLLVAYWKNIFLLCLVLGFLHLTNATDGANETDRAALLAFKDRITDDPFEVLSSWNDSVHFCLWRGVICSARHQRVTTLNLQHQKLWGSMSPYIGNLSYLHQLVLDNNSFTGEIPQELGGLKRLRILWLRNNSLDGEIPTSLSNCSSLVEIQLSRNRLVGKIPREFSSLSNLRLIRAALNNLTGSIPPSFGNLSSLQILGFASNSLTGSIPNELGQLKRLEYIGISENKLSGTFPQTIFNLSVLTTIFPPLNQIQGTLPSYLGFTLPNLYYFAIADNQFTGTIPLSMSNMSNLQSLFIGGNKFTGSVPNLAELHKLNRLDISGNHLGSGDSNDLSFISTLTNASNLEELDLYDNNFGGELPESFGNLSTKLTGLLVSDNQLSGRIPNWIGNFVNLIDIDMRGNQFTGIIPIEVGKLRSIRILDLSHNHLSGNIPTFLGNLSLLTKLHLDDNNFYGEIPSTLGLCQTLQALNLSQNKLSGIIPPQVFDLPSLVLYLDLSNNQLVGSLPTEVGTLENLNELVVSRNNLSGEIPSSVGRCESLEKLYMEKNFFYGSIPSSFSSLRGLRYLDISQNNLSGQIPEYLGSFDLQFLNLSFNDLQGVLPEEGIFKNANKFSVTGNPKLCGGTPDLKVPRCTTKHSTKFISTLTFTLMVSIVSALLGSSLLVGLVFHYWSKTSKVNFGDSSRGSFFKVSYHSLYRATDGFSSANLIGVGSFSSVYKGILECTETIVAVKVFNLLQRGASKSFMVECEALRNVKHRNLVKVLSACSGIDNKGDDFRALIYEFMDNDCLEKWLHSDNELSIHKFHKLNLLQRINIAIDIASALDYLHNQCHNPIIHRDLKPSNVLLDSEMVGHVADFGIAKFLPTENISGNQSSSTAVKGTVGYTAPGMYGF